MILVFALFGLAQVNPVVTQRSVNQRVSTIRLAPRYTTAIKLPEAVSSVVVGDPSKFLAEHSDKEPTLVLVKPTTVEAAESNLLVTTIRGRQISFLLRSDSSGSQAGVDFVVNYQSEKALLIEEVAVTHPPVVARFDQTLERLLEGQQRAAIPRLSGGNRIKAGVSRVIDSGSQTIVLFSIVNPQGVAIEVLSPQVQLAGKVRSGFALKRSRWGTSQQLPVIEYRLTRRRIGPGERADGIAVFTRPNFKQSNETLFLQVAESGAVDQPALAPITKEASHDQ